MGHRPHALAALVVVNLGCTQHNDLRWLAGDDARAAVLLTLEPGDTIVTAETLALGDSPFQRSLELGQRGTLILLTYPKTLLELGLPPSPGPLNLVPPGSPTPAIDLPPASAQHSLDLSQQEGWLPLATLPPSVIGLRVQKDVCIKFNSAQFAIEAPIPSIPTLLLAADASRLLLATSSQLSFVLSRTGASLYTGLSTSSVFVGGHRDSSGELWVIDNQGTLLHGDLDRGFQPGPRLPDWKPYVAGLAGSQNGAPFELFAMTATHAISHFQDGRWTLLAGPRGPTPPNIKAYSELGWLEPGVAGAIGLSADGVIESSLGRELTLDVSPSVHANAVNALRWVEGIGPMIGSNWGELFVRGAQGWAKQPPPRTNNRVSALVALPGGKGVLVGGNRGLLEQYFPGVGYCAEEALLPDETHFGAPIDGGLLFVTASSNGLMATILTPVGP